MQTSRFQLGLIATLAIGLGFSLSSSEAVGYPAGPAVSLGSNPVQSFGGSLTVGSSTTLHTIPTDQNFVVTDISLMAKSGTNACLDKVDVEVLATDTTVAAYNVSTSYQRGSDGNHTLADSVTQSMVSGLRIEGGETLSLSASLYGTFTYSGCSSSRATTIVYALSGYYAQS